MREHINGHTEREKKRQTDASTQTKTEMVYWETDKKRSGEKSQRHQHDVKNGKTETEKYDMKDNYKQ